MGYRTRGNANVNAKFPQYAIFSRYAMFSHVAKFSHVASYIPQDAKFPRLSKLEIDNVDAFSQKVYLKLRRTFKSMKLLT